VNEREFKELVKKGYLKPVVEKGKAIKKYRTTESGRAFCTGKLDKLPLVKYAKQVESEQVSDEVFLKVLRSAYTSLFKTSPIAPYVKISLLRMKVSAELKMSGEEFDRRVIELNSSNPYAMQLHVGSGDPSEGVRTSRGVYHYAIVK
jgi:predicted methyltransferase